MAVNAESASHFLARRADFQAATEAPIANTTNKGLKSGKNGAPPLLGSSAYVFKDSGGDALHFGTVINSLKTCPPHQIPQTKIDVIKSADATLCLISILSARLKSEAGRVAGRDCSDPAP